MFKLKSKKQINCSQCTKAILEFNVKTLKSEYICKYNKKEGACNGK